MINYEHISVLSNEVIDFLKPSKNQNFVDGTLGGGGHSQAILEKNGPQGKILAFEMDQRAINAAQERLEEYKDRIIIVHQSYVHLEKEIKNHKFDNISGIILDLGLSSDQLDKADRGFSFKDHGLLDMRFNPDGQTLTASEIILTWPEIKLEKIFREYGDVKKARHLARGIILWRTTLDSATADKGKQKQKSIKTSILVDVILRILNIKNPRRFRIHPSTRIFQSLRIAVNDELGNLEKVLPQAYNVLAKGGRLAVISFHSAEDRIVKHYFKKLAQGCICLPASPICNCQNKSKVKILTKKAIRPSEQEIQNNRRSRSAILRVIEKI